MVKDQDSPKNGERSGLKEIEAPKIGISTMEIYGDSGDIMKP